jgi:hypothetical protein
MTDPAADNPERGGRGSADGRNRVEQSQVQATVRDMVGSLESSISRSRGRRLYLIPIGSIALIGLSFLAALAFGPDFIPYFLVVGIAAFVLGSFVSLALGGITELFEKLTLARTARRFTEQFPEGSPARPSAIAMLSEIETPHKAGQKLLKTLSTPEKRTPAISRQGFQGCVIAALPVVLIVMAIAFYARASGEAKELVAGASYGVVFGVFFGRLDKPGLRAALTYTFAGPILFGISGMIYVWISRKYGGYEALCFLGVVFCVRDRLLPFLEKENEPK